MSLCVSFYVFFSLSFFSPSSCTEVVFSFSLSSLRSLSLSLTQLGPPRGRPRASREWFRFPRSDALRGWLRGLYEAQRLGLMGLMHREGWITFEDGGCLEFSVESFRFPLFQSFFLIHFGIKIQIPLMHYRKKKVHALFACTLSSKIRDTFPGNIIDSFLRIFWKNTKFSMIDFELLFFIHETSINS